MSTLYFFSEIALVFYPFSWGNDLLSFKRYFFVIISRHRLVIFSSAQVLHHKRLVTTEHYRIDQNTFPSSRRGHICCWSVADGGRARCGAASRPFIMAVHPHDETSNSNYAPPSTSNIALTRPRYSKLSEVLRKKTPSSVLCRTFCGGRKCRYDQFDCWNKEDMAVDGLYSHW